MFMISLSSKAILIELTCRRHKKRETKESFFKACFPKPIGYRFGTSTPYFNFYYLTVTQWFQDTMSMLSNFYCFQTQELVDENPTRDVGLSKAVGTTRNPFASTPLRSAPNVFNMEDNLRQKSEMKILRAQLRQIQAEHRNEQGEYTEFLFSQNDTSGTEIPLWAVLPKLFYTLIECSFRPTRLGLG